MSKTLPAFLLALGAFLFLRFWNFPDYLYFIYDQGRDATRLAEIAQGSFALVGPTTGLEGLFLGPFWYYVGVIGFILTQGSPEGLAAWFILISTLAFPGFWWLSRLLFHQGKAAKLFSSVCLLFFIALPGSIISSTTIWNPLLAAPLMLASLYSFWRVRQSSTKELWLGLGFFSLALTLQSEFAYAVFFLPVLLACIPWITERRRVRDFLISLGAIIVTLLPQLAFELRHQFIMLSSLRRGLSESSHAVSWGHQFTHRPQQLLSTTVDMFTNPAPDTLTIQLIIIAVLIIGAGAVIVKTFHHYRTNTPVSPVLFAQQLVVLFAVIPYPFYMLWRGNNGNFFSYYLTPHFVFLFPLLVLGLQELFDRLSRQALGTLIAGVLSVSVLLPVTFGAIDHWVNAVSHPVNEAGLQRMRQAVEEAYRWRQSDRTSTLIITPNIHSLHYDYLFRTVAKQQSVDSPRTVVLPEDTQMILVLEQSGSQYADYVVAQRKALTEATQWRRTRVKLFGMVTVEEWQRDAKK